MDIEDLLMDDIEFEIKMKKMTMKMNKQPQSRQERIDAYRMNIAHGNKAVQYGRIIFDKHLGNNEKDISTSLTEVSVRNLYNKDLVSRNVGLTDNQLVL